VRFSASRASLNCARRAASSSAIRAREVFREVSTIVKKPVTIPQPTKVDLWRKPKSIIMGIIRYWGKGIMKKKGKIHNPRQIG
jgi:hypothetical protein